MNHPATTPTGTRPAFAVRSAPGADQPARIGKIDTTEAAAIGLHQMAFNALATASWHIARGEPTQALSRIKRAQSHLAHSIEGGVA